ncbi:MAG TPA: UDP-N-acetylenolpyruvoylglucosamine reductase [Myxococcales bacterium]|nr:UDP-N-acetylenolpyruvoylglucosamine reductase [Deltaproteobacteria bacterium]MBU52697.1 UDP-N-acetylenolpyruvoylglucosamine reductase [Deltaproteobacteria bacterium]HAA54615.1 UDP-N-acetylenolpyruvoylglucosamine reductase [Myxococcales bacterium]
MSTLSIPPTLPVSSQVSMADKTTLRLGGPAQFFATPTTRDDLLACLVWADTHALPVTILGGGSNVVVADKGISGLVLQYAASDKQILREDQGHVYVRVDAGHEWDAFVEWSVKQDLAGVECLSGIPGHVGAAPIQNIGAYGQDVSETFMSAEILDRESHQIQTWDKEACAFGYRDSRLKQSPKGRYIVLSVTFSLTKDGPPTLRYPELQRSVQEQTSPQSLQTVRQQVLSLRKKKSMVIDPNDPNSQSAGSFFVNPIISDKQADQVAEKMKHTLKQGEKMPRYPAGPGQSKLSAAWLIDRSGLHKGYGDGPIGLSDNHTLAIVHKGNGSTQALMTFAEHIREHVRKAAGVELVQEPVLLGFENK